MSYISTTVDKNTVIVWERNEAGERIIRDYPSPLYFYYDDPAGEYKTIYDTPVSKVTYKTVSEYRAGKKQFEAERIRTWESDITPDVRVLSNKYFGVPAPKLNVTFLDIEVDYDPDIGFSSPENPYAPINAVAIYHRWLKEYVVLVVPPEPGWTEERLSSAVDIVCPEAPVPTNALIRYVVCQDERELLVHLLIEIENSDVMSGWNCIPIGQSIWHTNSIQPIGSITSDANLMMGDLVTVFPRSYKRAYQTTTVLGNTVQSSIDHKFFVKCHPKDKYTDLEQTPIEELSLSQVVQRMETDAVFMQHVLRDNKNVDVTDTTLNQLYLAGLIYTDGTLVDPGATRSGYRIFQSDVDLLNDLPLIDTQVVGPHKGCYSRGVKRSLLSDFTHSLIYDGRNKRLDKSLLSLLSHEQFCAFLAGLVDGDGYVSKGSIEWCNYNGDIPTLQELCMWNGILTSSNVMGRSPRLRFLIPVHTRLPVRKHTRWINLAPTTLVRQSSQKASLIKFKQIGDRVFSRIHSVEDTGCDVEMIDIETTTHQFVTSGTVVHNCDFFDIPYIAQRILRVLDNEVIDLSTITDMSNPKRPRLAYDNNPNQTIARTGRFKYLKQLDFPTYGMPSFRPVPNATNGKLMGHTVDLVGRVRVDYMNLIKKFEPGERQSYKLSSVSDEVLVDEKTGEPLLPKLEYSGSLANLYRDNFAYFVRYNIRDTEILEGFEIKLGYVELANQLCHLSTGLFTHVQGTLKLAELALTNYCHHTLKRVVNNNTAPEEDRQIDGALVLYPQVGLHELVGSVDINSLYPSAIRSINISPEMIRGQFTGCAPDATEIAKGSDRLLTLILEDDDKTELTLTAKAWREKFIELKWAVSGYGTIFDQTENGFIPALLAEWYVMRRQYQAKKKEAEAAGDAEAAAYYDRLQYVYKIKLNSLYGALTNMHFRFFDLRMGESTTGTGRAILKHQCRQINQELGGEYNVDFPLYDTVAMAMKSGYSKTEAELISLHGPYFQGKHPADAVVYGDTDSTYFKTYATSIEEATIIANAIADKVNDSYPEYMRQTFLCTPGYDTIIKAAREIVMDNGIFVEKKRYILHLVDLDGKKCDKMKVMGLDTKKTTLPAEVSAVLNKFIERYLKGETWDQLAKDIVEYKTTLLNFDDITRIGLPKGVQNVEDYTTAFEDNFKARLPGHVAASIFYNQCLKLYNDKVSTPIKSGMKIKVFYMKQRQGKFKSIALPTDLEFVPNWFHDNIVVDKQAHIERLVDNPLGNILKAIGKKTPTKHSLKVSRAISF